MISKKQMIEFINAQPDDRLVNMNKSYNRGSGPCCVMVQYVMDNGWEGNINVGYSSLSCKVNGRPALLRDNLDFMIDELVTDWDVKTFGELKLTLNTKC